mmetsp:Transcript_153269/g.267823  ORF Transcript_153269/g.267823 Transcript_153269/m.267823 type:complete len:271 (+) Transcript_153269:730-1542(+)
MAVWVSVSASGPRVEGTPVDPRAHASAGGRPNAVAERTSASVLGWVLVWVETWVSVTVEPSVSVEDIVSVRVEAMTEAAPASCAASGGQYGAVTEAECTGGNLLSGISAEAEMVWARDEGERGAPPPPEQSPASRVDSSVEGLPPSAPGIFHPAGSASTVSARTGLSQSSPMAWGGRWSMVDGRPRAESVAPSVVCCSTVSVRSHSVSGSLQNTTLFLGAFACTRTSGSSCGLVNVSSGRSRAACLRRSSSADRGVNKGETGPLNRGSQP